MSNNPIESTGVTMASKDCDWIPECDRSEELLRTKRKSTLAGYTLRKMPASDTKVELEVGHISFFNFE